MRYVVLYTAASGRPSFLLTDDPEHDLAALVEAGSVPAVAARSVKIAEVSAWFDGLRDLRQGWAQP